MRSLHRDPNFSAKRDERARVRFKGRNREMQRKSLAKRRGVDVPPELEDIWRALKRKRISNAEVARILGLTMVRKGKAP